MTTFTKTLIAAGAMLVCVGSASADNTFVADFTYTPTDSVEVIHATFERTAKKACRISRNEAGGISIKAKIEADCRRQLLNDAIAATKLEALIAYHARKTNPATAPVQLAETQ